MENPVSDGEGYIQIMKREIIPESQVVYGDRSDRIWWQKDRAPAHGKCGGKQYLQATFKRRKIGVGYDIERPLGSLDSSHVISFPGII